MNKKYQTLTIKGAILSLLLLTCIIFTKSDSHAFNTTRDVELDEEWQRLNITNYDEALQRAIIEMKKIEQELASIKIEQLLRLGWTPCTDPEILCHVHTIAQDLGAIQPIPVFITKDPTEQGSYIKNLGIALNLDTIGNDYVRLTNTVAHEIGHFMQHNLFPDSYHPVQNPATDDEKKLNAQRQETAADANAAGYADCHICLKKIQMRSWEENSPNHQKGYFSRQDIEPYIQRAQQNKWLCPAHRKLVAQTLVLFSKRFSFARSMKKNTMRDYLPVRDRTGYLPTPTPQELFADLQLPEAPKDSEQ